MASRARDAAVTHSASTSSGVVASAHGRARRRSGCRCASSSSRSRDASNRLLRGRARTCGGSPVDAARAVAGLVGAHAHEVRRVLRETRPRRAAGRSSGRARHQCGPAANGARWSARTAAPGRPRPAVPANRSRGSQARPARTRCGRAGRPPARTGARRVSNGHRVQALRSQRRPETSSPTTARSATAGVGAGRGGGSGRGVAPG